MGRDYVVVSCKAAESPKLLWASEAPVGVQPCQVAAPVGFERDWCDAKMITSLHHAEGHGVKQTCSSVFGVRIVSHPKCELSRIAPPTTLIIF